MDDNLCLIVNERYQCLRQKMSRRAHDKVRERARALGISTSEVIKDRHEALLSKSLWGLAASCFVSTRREWLLARISELQKLTRVLELELKKETHV